MEELSVRHQSALDWLTKANYDLALAIIELKNGNYETAYMKSTRVQESIRQLLEVDCNLSPMDRNNDNPMGMK